MNKNKQFFKLFIVLFFGTAFIFSFSHFGAKAFQKAANSDGEFSEGTTIGTLDLSGKTKVEATSLIEKAYVNWSKDTSIVLQYGEQSEEIDLKQFHLDTNKTLISLKDGQKNVAFITIEKAQVAAQVELLFPALKSTELDLDKLTAKLKETTSHLEAGSYTVNLYTDFLLAESKKAVILNTVMLVLNDVPRELQTFIENNPTIELKGETTFSLLGLARESNIENSYSLDVLATGIYQSVLPSNLMIKERNISSSLPEYASLGFEAKVDQSRNSDLVIANPNKANYNLDLELISNQLKVTLKGEKFAYTYKVSTKDEQKLKPKVIVQYSPLLLPGKTKVQAKGAEGHIIKVYRDVYQGASFVKSEIISEDYYPAAYRVEIHGLGGNQQVQTSTVTQNQTTAVINSQTTTSADNTTTVGDPDQPDTTESDIWGNPNEQPK